MPNHNPDHIEFALELLNELDTQPAAGCNLCQMALDLCHAGQFAESVSCCRQLYQMGLERSDTYLQGLARICLGSVYFALGDASAGWETAIEHVKDSAQKFHTYLDPHCDHNEGVAWFLLGRIYQAQCLQSNKRRWEEAIQAYRKSLDLFQCKEDRLVPKAQAALESATEGLGEWLTHPAPQPAAGRLLWIVPTNHNGVVRVANQWKTLPPGEHRLADPQVLRMVVPTQVLQVPSLPFELKTADGKTVQFVILLKYQVVNPSAAATFVMEYLFPKVSFYLIPPELVEYVLSDHAQSGLETVVRDLVPHTPSIDFIQNGGKLGRMVRDRLGMIVRVDGLSILAAIVQNPEIL